MRRTLLLPGITLYYVGKGDFILPEDHNSIKEALKKVVEYINTFHGGFTTHPEVPSEVDSIREVVRGDYVLASDWNYIYDILTKIKEELDAKGFSSANYEKFKYYYSLLDYVRPGEVVNPIDWNNRVDAIRYLLESTRSRFLRWDFDTPEELEDYATDVKYSYVSGGLLVHEPPPDRLEEAHAWRIYSNRAVYKVRIKLKYQSGECVRTYECAIIFSYDGTHPERYLGLMVHETDYNKFRLVTMEENNGRKYVYGPEFDNPGTFFILEFDYLNAKGYAKRLDESIIAEIDLPPLTRTYPVYEINTRATTCRTATLEYIQTIMWVDWVEIEEILI